MNRETAPDALVSDIRSGLSTYIWKPWKVILFGLAATFILGGIVFNLIPKPEEPTSPKPSTSEQQNRVPEFTPPAPGDSDLSEKPSGGGIQGLLPELDDIGSNPTSPSDRSTPPDHPPEAPPPTSDPTTPAGPTPALDAGSTETDPLSPAFVRHGFGFFIGFCVGFALRSLFRFSLILVGVQVMVLAVFSSLGWVEVRWDVITQAWEGYSADLSGQFETFRTFLAGEIPSAALSAAGFYTGLRRK